MARNTAAATTTMRTISDAMCSFTTDWRWVTCIDGMIRYQWPRIIAVQAVPSNAAELRKLAIVSTSIGNGLSATTTIACATMAMSPPPTAVQTRNGRIAASVRPTVAQYMTMASSDTTSAASATVCAVPPSADSGRKARAIAIRMAARPALKRKNLTPASRDTNSSVPTIPRPRWARKRKRTVVRDTGRKGGRGRRGRKGGWVGRLALPAFPAYPSSRAAKALADLGSVTDVPPRVDVVRPAVLVLQIVGVLPDVDAEDGLLAVHERAVLIRSAFNGQLAAGVDHPRPAAAEAADGCLLQFLLELVEAAERSVDRIRNRAGRRATRLGPHDLPEHRVVRVAAAVVAHGGANVFRDGVDVLQQVVNALGLQLGMLLERRVQVRDVRVVMLPVMDFHRLLVDVGFESIGRVRKWRERVSHRTLLRKLEAGSQKWTAMLLSRPSLRLQPSNFTELTACGRAQPSSNASGGQGRRCGCARDRRAGRRAPTADDSARRGTSSSRGSRTGRAT